MLLKRNLLESLTIICCGGSLICILLNYVTNISPITGVWFPIYTFLLFIVALSSSIKILQWLLRLNKPLTYDQEELVKEYPYLGLLSSVLPTVPARRKGLKFSEEYKEYDTNELSVISTVLERKLVSSWYVPFISQEIGFPFACKQILDQMIGKAFQITNKIETKDVCIDICSVLIMHLKEYKKTLKRHEKSPNSSIESLYKKAYTASEDKKTQPADHCVHILRIIFKELVPWELWDTPHSELLVRILSKKLDNFIDTTIADPVWLNDKLLSFILDKHTRTYPPETEQKVPDDSSMKTEVIKEVSNTESKSDEQETKNKSENSIEQALATIIQDTTAPILQRAIDQVCQEVPVTNSIQDVEDTVEETGSDPLEAQASPVMRQRRGRQGKNEVKIYDRIIEGSTKTWETDMDLQCISLGQDLLASLDGEITLSRLWGQDGEPDGSPNPPRGKSPMPTWFGDDELDMELTPPDTSPPLSAHKHSPKPTDLLIKDLQTTVHQAKSRIGDLQDEAAGMMEGLLDFGIAGLRKGLRFTGLSDDTQDRDKSSPNGKELGTFPLLHLERMKLAAGEPRDVKIAAEPKELNFAAGEPRGTKIAAEPKELNFAAGEPRGTKIAAEPKELNFAAGEPRGTKIAAEPKELNFAAGEPRGTKIAAEPKELNFAAGEPRGTKIAAEPKELKLSAGEPRDVKIATEPKELKFSTGKPKDVKASNELNDFRGGETEIKLVTGEPKEVKFVASEAKDIKGASQKDEMVNGTNGVPHLVKQHRVLSQDSVPALPPRRPPPLSPLAPESPEPQYEEAADLSTSIAKLRSLLQQRADAEASSGSVSGDIWWEGAEETRGRTQQRHCSRPVDAATCADEYDMNTEQSSSPGQTSNNMQRLDKLFHRTVTGVFNSIKTAVGAEGDEPIAGAARGTGGEWAYVCTSVELSVMCAVGRLVGSRRAHAHVDAALDSLEQLQPPAQGTTHDAVDDLDEWCAVNGACYSAVSELLCAAELTHSHVTHRVAALLLAEISEALIHSWLDQLTAWLKTEIFASFEQMSRQADSEDTARVMREMDLEETRKALLEKLPAPLQLFGEDRLSAAVTLVTSSLSHKELNRDVLYRLLDLFALRFHRSAGLRNPSFES